MTRAGAQITTHQMSEPEITAAVSVTGTNAINNQSALSFTASASSNDGSTPRKKNAAAAALGRRGGRKGGKARAERMTTEQLRASAQKAAAMRWAKPPAAMVTPLETIEFAADGEALPPSPFAKHKGELSLGGHAVDVFVLDTGDRVISLGAVVKTISGVDASNLGDYIGVKSLKPFLDSDLILGETHDFHIPGTQLRGRGKILCWRLKSIS